MADYRAYKQNSGNRCQPKESSGVNGSVANIGLNIEGDENG
jgi:hypothetical protein